VHHQAETVGEIDRQDFCPPARSENSGADQYTDIGYWRIAKEFTEPNIDCVNRQPREICLDTAADGLDFG
jgi:hypothetical protein